MAGRSLPGDEAPPANVTIRDPKWTGPAAKIFPKPTLRSTVRRPIIVDARNALDGWRWVDAGWTSRGLGRQFA